MVIEDAHLANWTCAALLHGIYRRQFKRQLLPPSVVSHGQGLHHRKRAGFRKQKGKRVLSIFIGVEQREDLAIAGAYQMIFDRLKRIAYIGVFRELALHNLSQRRQYVHLSTHCFVIFEILVRGTEQTAAVPVAIDLFRQRYIAPGQTADNKIHQIILSATIPSVRNH